MQADHLVIFGPLPPTRSGIADYLWEQLPYLREQLRVTVVVDDDEDLSTVRRRWPDLDVKPFSQWEDEPAREALFLHHVGNNRHHSFVRKAVQRYPGVVVLHDFLQHHLVADQTLGQGDFLGYQGVLGHEYGPVGELVARDRADGIFSEFEQFLLPLNRHIIEASKGVIVHSSWAYTAVRQMGLAVPVTTIPHHFSPPERLPDQHKAREELDIPLDVSVIACLGHITPPKQISLLLRALASLKDYVAPFLLYLAGEPHDRNYWQREIETAGLSERTIITGYLPIEGLFLHARAADIVVNLRYPTAGETSGTLVRALGIGATCVVFDYGPFSDYPDGIVSKIPLTTRDVAPLAQTITELLLSPRLRIALSQRSRQYIRTRNNLRSCARQFVAFLLRCSHSEKGPAKVASNTWSRASVVSRHIDLSTLVKIITEELQSRKGYQDKNDDVGACLSRIIPLLGKVSVAAGSEARALIFDEEAIILPSLRHLFRYKEVLGLVLHDQRKSGWAIDTYEWSGNQEVYPIYFGDVERQRLDIVDGHLDLIVGNGLLEQLARDPISVLAEFNRILKPGGVLILSAPNIVSYRSLSEFVAGRWPFHRGVSVSDGAVHGGYVEYAPAEVRQLLEAAGFQVNLETHNVAGPSEDIRELLLRNSAVQLRGELLVCVCVKVGVVVERYPEGLYHSRERSFEWAREVFKEGV